MSYIRVFGGTREKPFITARMCIAFTEQTEDLGLKFALRGEEKQFTEASYQLSGSTTNRCYTLVL